MTWAELLKILQQMSANKHTSMDKQVQMVVDGNIYVCDVIESITTGDTYITPMIDNIEEEEVED